jgi:hypothetical protein
MSVDYTCAIDAHELCNEIEKVLKKSLPSSMSKGFSFVA